MTKIGTRRIFRIALFAGVALSLGQSPGAAQLIGGASSPGFIVDRQDTSRGNAIAVDSNFVYFAWYSLGDAGTGTPPSVRYEAFPLVVSCVHVPCGFTPPSPTTIDVIGAVPTTPPGGAAFAYSISIALGPDGTPHIVYQDGSGHARHAELCPCADNPNIGWMLENIPVPASLYSSMAVDRSGALHVATSAGSLITYAKKANGVWTSESIIGPVSLSSLSLAVDSAGNRLIAWADHHSTFNELIYATRGNSAFPWVSSNFEIVTSQDAEWISLAQDPTGVPHISYWGWPDNGSLSSEIVYTSRLGPGFWSPQVVAGFPLPCCLSSPYVYHETALAFTPSGSPRITYGYDLGSGNAGVALARNDGFFWNKQALDVDPTGVFMSTSLVVDASDVAHILYPISNCAPIVGCDPILRYARIATANTLVGAPVTVDLGDPAGTGSQLTVTFSQVTQQGLTSAALDDPGNQPAPPPTFELGNPPVVYDIETTATYVGPVNVCIPYANVQNPAGLKLMHNENGVWVDRTVSNDTAAHVICASSTSLSPFAVMQGQAPPACTSDVTSSVSVTRSGYSYSPISRRYSQILTLTNTGQNAISGPVYLVIDGLSANASLLNASGKTSCAAPTGSSYVSLAGPLAPGTGTPVVLQYTDPNNAAITYTPRILAGAGQP